MDPRRIARLVAGALLAYAFLTMLGTIDARVSGPISPSAHGQQVTAGLR